MGEISKKRGEHGELTVERLLDLIGWQSNSKGISIDCNRPLDHAISTRNRTTHGIDFLFQYDSHFYNKTNEFVLISAKLNDHYPSNPVAKFKGHLKDLATTLECFKKSSKKYQLSVSGKENCYSGVIFWIDNLSDDDFDLLDRLAESRNDEGDDFEVIYLVDNKRANFLYRSIKFAQKTYDKHYIEFYIPNTGHNNTLTTRTSSSPILPVQYLNTSILPLKVVQKDASSEILALFVIDDYEAEHLPHLMSLAHSLTEGWANHIHILYPKYVPGQSDDIIADAKVKFRDHKFFRKIEVGSYLLDFRQDEIDT